MVFGGADNEVRDKSFYYYALIGNTALFLALYNFCDHLLDILSISYRTLPEKKRIDWRIRFVSSVHAIIISSLSFYLFVYDEKLNADFLRGVSHDSLIVCTIACGYMIADTIVLIYHYKKIGEAIFIVHHVATILPFYFVWEMKLYLYLAMLRLFAELSTINVNLRVILHDCDMKWGSAYYYNGLLMLFTFTIARIIPMPYSYYTLYMSQEAPTTYYHLPGTLLAGFTLDAMNLYWYRKMVLGALRVLRRRSSTAEEAANSTSSQSSNQKTD